MTLKARVVAAALKKKGFLEDTSGNHVYYWYWFNDRKTTIRTCISHGEDEIDKWLICKMARQLFLSKDDFVELVSCSLDADAYRERMVFEGHILP